MSRQILTDCTGCPCLNSDYEQGSWCKLPFSEKYEILRFPDGRTEWCDVSPDCGLDAVVYDKLCGGVPERVIFKPAKLEVEGRNADHEILVVGGEAQ